LSVTVAFAQIALASPASVASPREAAQLLHGLERGHPHRRQVDVLVDSLADRADLDRAEPARRVSR